MKVYHGTNQDFEYSRNFVLWTSTDPDLAFSYAYERTQGEGSLIIPIEASCSTLFDADKLNKSVSIGEFLVEMVKQSPIENKDMLRSHMRDKLKQIHKNLKDSGLEKQRSIKHDVHLIWFDADTFGTKNQEILHHTFVELQFNCIQFTENNIKTLGLLPNSESINTLSKKPVFSSDLSFTPFAKENYSFFSSASF